MLESLGDEMDAYWHRFESGHILRISPSIAMKCREEETGRLDEVKLISHYTLVLRTVFKMHEKARDNIEEYLSLFKPENFQIIDQTHLLIHTHHANLT